MPSKTLSFAPLCLALVLVCANLPAQQKKPLYLDPSQPVAARVNDLVGRMTLEEKVSQMQNHAVAIPRLDVPEYDWWSEGLHGIARSGYATVFPQAIGLAATWDTPLMKEAATVISTETRAKYSEALRHNIHSRYFGLGLWAPNINIFRDPRWGRGQETYGEDPFLTSQMGVAFVEGVQGNNPRYDKAIATPKHYVVHSGPESTRHTANVDVSPHDLEDTYLPAFRATVKDAKAGSVMCAYNAIDGEPACANTFLLTDVLRKDWGFRGFITSDCRAITDVAKGHKFAPDLEHAAAVSVRAGTDTSCGPEYAELVKAVHDGLVSESEIDTAVKRLFTARFKLGMFDPASDVPYARIPFSQNDSEAHRLLARTVAEKSMVLLKNDGILPLRKSVKTIAVIGPNAATLAAIEGNYNAVPSRPVLPLSGIESRFGSQAKILYTQGSPYVSELPLPAPRTVFHPASGDARFGLQGEYFNNLDFTGKPAFTRIDQQVDFDWDAASPGPGLDASAFSVRWTGTITAPKPGNYTFSFDLTQCFYASCGDSEKVTVYLDGKPIPDHGTASRESHSNSIKPFTLTFADTTPHTLRIDYSHHAPLFGAGLAFDWMPPIEAERDAAVSIAKKADVAIVFVGLSPNLEGEEMPVHIEGFDGGDRTEIELPAVQKQLLEAVAATGKPVVVVMLNGSALAMNWANRHAAAILEAWYPGEEGGNAIASTLAGDSDPGGRLPVTFYKSTNQLPPFDDYSMKDRTYRYFTGTPLWGFGYGLSYTKFQWSNVKLSTGKLTAGEPLTVDADVKNIGLRKGDAVSELYLKAPSSPTTPLHALVGFAHTPLGPGQQQHIHLVISPRSFSVVAADGKRSINPGEYSLFLGGSQPGPAGTGVTKSFSIVGSKGLSR